MYSLKAVAGILAVQCLLWADGTVGSWSEVEKLPSGGKVTVVHSDGSVVRGTVEAAGTDSIAVRHRKSVRSFPRAEVVKVAVPRKGGRARYAWIGAAVGAGAGAGVFGGYSASGKRPDNWAKIMAIGGGILGAGPGALIGYLASPSERAIYQGARPLRK